MDREISSSYKQGQLRRRVGLTLGSLVFLLAIGILLPGWLRPGVARERIRLGKVDRGTVEGVVEASGQVIPAFEAVLSSPVEARVDKILKRPGDLVKAGDEILALDTSASQVEVGRLGDQLRKKENEQLQVRLALEQSLRQLEGRLASQQLDLEALLYRAEQNRKLRAEGLVSEQVLRASEVEAKKAQIELTQLEAAAQSERGTTAARLEGLELDLATLRRDQGEARRQLELATTRSATAGVLTWVVPQEGATVRKGEVIARIADLASFRVAAKVSDIHSAKLMAGMPVRVRLDGQTLSGRLAQVFPTIENGSVKFEVELDEPRHAGLRNNLTVDVLVLTAARQDVLRAPKGPYLQGGAAEPVFVVDRNDPSRALRRQVRLGLAGYDRYEVLDGLAEGDEVIVSDMRDYIHLSRLDLK